MSQQTPLMTETASEIRQFTIDHPPGGGKEEEAGIGLNPSLIDAVLDVAALIDADCCRCGEWIDWRRYRPHPPLSTDKDGTPASIIRLALAENACGLRDGGYIEIRVLDEDVIETNGGYYDGYHQPETVIEGSFRPREAGHQAVGQALMLMFNRIVQAYTAIETFGERPCESPQCSS